MKKESEQQCNFCRYSFFSVTTTKTTISCVQHSYAMWFFPLHFLINLIAGFCLKNYGDALLILLFIYLESKNYSVIE